MFYLIKIVCCVFALLAPSPHTTRASAANRNSEEIEIGEQTNTHHALSKEIAWFFAKCLFYVIPVFFSIFLMFLSLKFSR